MKRRVLVIHRNQSLGSEIQTALCSATVIVDTVFSLSEAVDLFLHYDYSLILLYIDTDGKEIIKPLRAITQVPILALCDQDDPKERCAMLKAGASACLSKPIDLQECKAQVEALFNLYFATSEKKAVPRPCPMPSSCCEGSLVSETLLVYPYRPARSIGPGRSSYDIVPHQKIFPARFQTH